MENAWHQIPYDHEMKNCLHNYTRLLKCTVYNLCRKQSYYVLCKSVLAKYDSEGGARKNVIYTIITLFSDLLVWFHHKYF